MSKDPVEEAAEAKRVAEAIDRQYLEDETKKLAKDIDRQYLEERQKQKLYRPPYRQYDGPVEARVAELEMALKAVRIALRAAYGTEPKTALKIVAEAIGPDEG